GTLTTDTVTIIEPTPPTIEFHASAQSVNYNASSATVEVDLSATSSQTITVHYLANDGSAHAGTDYTATSGTLTIPAGNISGTFTVPILGYAETNNVTFSLN